MPKNLSASLSLFLVLILHSLMFSHSNASEGECKNTSEIIDYWRNIRETADTVDANDYAISLSSCLASPNPELRDRVGYEVLTYWLRKDKLDISIINELTQNLLSGLTKGVGTTDGEHAFERAFSALILSEIIRDDGRHLRWTTEKLNEVVIKSRKMFEAERDYRGLDNKYGWIHTIAHGSDLLWRLSLHPKITDQQQTEILTSLITQIARPNAPAYIFNEADRLSRVVIAIISSEKLDTEIIIKWVSKIGLSTPMSNWNSAFATAEGMARLHNTKQFLRALRQPLQANPESEIIMAIDKILAEMP